MKYKEYKDLGSFLSDLKITELTENTKLILRDKNLNDSHIQLIAQALESGRCLAKLHIILESNGISKFGIRYIAEALASGKCPKDLLLNLGWNNIGEDGTRYLANALKSGKCPEGLQLSLWKNNLGIVGAKYIAQALQSGQCPLGLQLVLWMNDIGPQGMQYIAHALQSGCCPKNLVLDLRGNNIGVNGTKHVALALQTKRCPAGLQINLRENHISAKGASYIALALQSGECPEGLQLNLSSNNIGAKGTEYIAFALTTGMCPKGLQLDLWDNQIGDAGILALKNALLSGNCPKGLNLLNLEISQQDLLQNLNDVLDNLLTQNADGLKDEWVLFQKILYSFLDLYPDLIWEDLKLKEKIQELLLNSLQSLSAESLDAITEEVYQAHYLPAFLEIAQLIFAIYDHVIKKPQFESELKPWLTTSLLALASAIVPHDKSLLKPDTGIWATTQQLILLEKAFTSIADKTGVLVHHWQDYCDEFNSVDKSERKIITDCALENILNSRKNCFAIAYFKKIQSENFLKLPISLQEQSILASPGREITQSVGYFFQADSDGGCSSSSPQEKTYLHLQ